MIDLPDVMRALVALPFDAHAEVTGITNLTIPKVAQRSFDTNGLFWAAPFATGTSGTAYAFRLTPGPGHGAVLRCVSGHAVTIASSPDRAIFAILACERLLRGDESRARVHKGWSKTSKARKVLRDAVTITGGEPDRLDAVLHMADALPKKIKNATPEELAERRAMLHKITDEPAQTDPAWARSDASRAAPDDAQACLELLQGNHGLDGTHFLAGLSPGEDEARELLVACAKAVKKAKLKPDPKWAAVIASLAGGKGHPESEDFIKPIGGTPSQESWEALAMATFWFHAVAEDVPPEQIALAEKMAGKIAKPILEARRALAGR
jgi:hypothetical protein